MLHVKVRVRAARRLCFDLENRPLAYWYDGQTTSEITAFGWRWDHDEPGHVNTLMLRPRGRFEDDGGSLLRYERAYERFVKEMLSADLVYGHNIRRHDLPMLQGQLLRLRMTPLPVLRTSDTCLDYPKRKDMSASLENLAGFYGLSGEKVKLTQADWEASNRLEDGGVALARERVKSDVLLQTELRATLIGLGVLGDPRWWPRRPA